MKRIAVLSIFIFTLFSISRSYAQLTPPVVKYNGKSTKFAIMVSDVLHFKAAIMTAEQLDISEKKYSFEIVVVGGLAKSLVEEAAALKESLDKAYKTGVRITVCQNALDYFGVDKSKLDNRLQIVSNGWIQLLELQDHGYNTLSV